MGASGWRLQRVGARALSRVRGSQTMTEIGPTLETSRLILRPPRMEDFEPYAAFMASDAARFVGGPIPPSATWRMLMTLVGAWVVQGYSMFSWIEKESGRWVGRGGPWHPHDWPGAEVGWATVVEAQRRGYAKEAATAAIDWAFDQLGWTEVIHPIDPLNAPSIATAKSLGSSLLRTGVAAPAPIVATWDIYGQTREQWRVCKR
jgi:RimJ/RimL family protein N-acetyltransferase